ncbi:MAG: SDR family NAD(P)-dependent oxidoreductase, partial [Tannerella sp.]|nr:SDR family NAD(P)-dependent oxidoreductase [Tannerella sp.]
MVKDLFCLKGKTALVTGGGQGIGRAVCLALAEHGANIIINYKSNRDKAEQTQKEVLESGVKSWLWEYNLDSETLKSDYSDFCNRILQYADILVLNASIQIRKAWDEVTLSEFNNQINVNLRTSLELIQHCVPYMEKNRWGRIITLGSV